MEPSNLVREIQDRQTQVTRRLGQIQQQLYQLEDQYLEATVLRGNAVKGWEGYLDYKARGNAAGLMAKKDRKVKASERLLSFSSMSAPIPKADLERDEDAMATVHWAKHYASEVANALALAAKEAAVMEGQKEESTGSSKLASPSSTPATTTAPNAKKQRKE